MSSSSYSEIGDTMSVDVSHPIILLDQPADGYAETLGWVEVTVTEDEARDHLREFCLDEDGEMGFRPVGAASREFLAPEVPLGSEDFGTGEEIMWQPVEPDAEGAVEFWKIVVA